MRDSVCVVVVLMFNKLKIAQAWSGIYPERGYKVLWAGSAVVTTPASGVARLCGGRQGNVVTGSWPVTSEALRLTGFWRRCSRYPLCRALPCEAFPPPGFILALGRFALWRFPAGLAPAGI